MYRIGCDVGGTNTDAAVLDASSVSNPSQAVLATYKTSTTINVTDGIKAAIEQVLVDSDIDRSNVVNVAIGTTHFVNAVVENDARRLSRVACVRLCGPYTTSNPPFSDYPYSLRDVIEGPIFYLDGGLEIDGREIKPLNEGQIRTTADAIAATGIRAVAVVGVFSALDHEGIHEERCKQLMLEAQPQLSVVCSHSIGGPGLLTRENATILNAAILDYAKKTIRSFVDVMGFLGLQCPLFLTQNDGTLIEAHLAAKLPIKTFASGPTNSLMGAAFLQGQNSFSQFADKQVLVVDVGGTTTDVAALMPSGFPRKAPNFVDVGGVRTAFSMPDVYSVGLGGGSVVTIDDKGVCKIGPDSLGHRLSQEAIVFGGRTLTTSDITVAVGAAKMGDPSLVQHIHESAIVAAKMEIMRIVKRAVEKMKVSAAPVVILLVGGGSVILPKEFDIPCIRPPHHDSANAVGAAVAKVSGDVDIIEVLENRDENSVVEKVKKMAIDAAVACGACEQHTEISEMTKIPLQYVTNKATRFVVKATGPLDTVSQLNRKFAPTIPVVNDGEGKLENEVEDPSKAHSKQNAEHRKGSMARPTADVDLAAYRPNVRDGVWYLSTVDVELLATGCGVLGTGGGGSPYNMALYVLETMRQNKGGQMRVIDPKTLEDDAICVFGAGYGAPSVSDERIKSGEEIFASIEHLNSVFGHDDFQGVVADEIGGGNGIVSLPTGARFDRPVVDCDLMGRAYPTIEHGTPYVYGEAVMPCSIADSKGNVGIVTSAENNTKLEAILRKVCIELGNAVAVAARPLSGKVIKELAIPRSLSQAWFLGRAVHLARQTKIDFIQAIGEATPVTLLYTGKIVDVSREVSRGYTMGKCVMEPVATDNQSSQSSTISGEKRNLVILFQNEYLVAYLTDSAKDDDRQEVLCVVPDLISILGSDGEALGSPELRYGLEVRVIGMPAHPLWCTPEGLKIGGPEYFGLNVPWKPLGEYTLPRSVIEEFS